MIDLQRVADTRLETEPFSWAKLDRLFAPADAAELARTFPRDHFKTVSSYDGEKQYHYEARSLVSMGADSPSYPEELSDAWRRLAAELVSPPYRSAISRLVGMDLMSAPVEVNVFHYGRGATLGPHLDLSDKLVTQTMYFNDEWDPADGGCLLILRSKNMADVFTEVVPIVGSAAIIVRSASSWHAVSPVIQGSASRRSLTATFYHPRSRSTLWPSNDATLLHRYDG